MPHNTTSLQSPAVRLGWLDGLRGWAILLVVGIHVWVKVHLGNQQGISLVSEHHMGLIFGNGTWGVQLFYVISGFTMCYMWHYYKRSPHKIRDFLIRRFFRLAPMMYVAILVAVVSGNDPFDMVRFILSLLFLTDFAPYSMGSYAPAGTTIDLEFTFYLLFPLLVPYMHKWWLVVVCAGVGILWDQMVSVLRYPFHIYFIFGQAVMFVVGGYVHHLIMQQRGIQLLHNYWAMPLIFILTLWVDDQAGLGVFHFAIMAVLYGIFMMSVAYTKTPLFDNKFMRLMGILSFSIYLIHPTFVAALASALKVYGGLAYGLVGMVLTLIPTTLVCWGTYTYIEKKGIHFGKFLIHRWT